MVPLIEAHQLPSPSCIQVLCPPGSLLPGAVQESPQVPRIPPQMSTGSGAKERIGFDDDTRAVKRKLGKNTAGSESFKACRAAQVQVKRESGTVLSCSEKSGPHTSLISGMANVWTGVMYKEMLQHQSNSNWVSCPSFHTNFFFHIKVSVLLQSDKERTRFPSCSYFSLREWNDCTDIWHKCFFWVSEILLFSSLPSLFLVLFFIVLHIWSWWDP